MKRTTAALPAQAYSSDAFGGVFAGSPWYRYNIDASAPNHIHPTFNVYLVKRGADVYKVQLIGYYGPAGESRRNEAEDEGLAAMIEGLADALDQGLVGNQRFPGRICIRLGRGRILRPLRAAPARSPGAPTRSSSSTFPAPAGSSMTRRRSGR